MSRITGRSKNKLNQPFRKSTIGQNCPSYLGPKMWNNLPSELKFAKNIDRFKHTIKDKFFNDLQSKMIAPSNSIEDTKSANKIVFFFFFGIFFNAIPAIFNLGCF